ncbi:MAG: FMN-binding protein [Bacteroidaceae bacterium]|nr:FMN-binding protein [Bacteroidaceae bacterium]
MKRVNLTLLLASACLYCSAQIMTKLDNKTYKVNTTQLSEGVRGYKGTTPIDITIKKDKIVSVVLLENKETPRFVNRVETELLPKYVGKKVNKCLREQPDGVTGATFSSRAVKENIRLALLYYKNNK